MSLAVLNVLVGLYASNSFSIVNYVSGLGCFGFGIYDVLKGLGG
jgi:hypothetical protein